MENTNNKIITVCYMLAGILVGIVIAVLFDSAAAIATGGFGRFLAQDWVRHGLPAALGLLTFILLQVNKGVHSWAEEVVTEIRRVVWPSRKDTTAMTIVVCVMLLISGALLGLLDVLSASVIDWLLHRNFGGLF